MPAALCHCLDRFQVILFGESSTGRPTPQATREAFAEGREGSDLCGQIEFRVAWCRCRRGSRGLPKNSVAPGEREVAKNQYPSCFVMLESSIHWPAELVDAVSPRGLLCTVHLRPVFSHFHVSLKLLWPPGLHFGRVFSPQGLDTRLSHPQKKSKETPNWF